MTPRLTPAMPHLLLCVCLTLCGVLTATSCEDEVATTSPQPPGAPGGGGKKSVGAQPAPSTVLLEDAGPVEELKDEEVPEAREDAAWAVVELRNPLAAMRLVSRLFGTSTTTVELGTRIATQFGISGLAAVEWEEPVVIAWLGSEHEPLVMLSVRDPNEFLTPLPTQRVLQRQGNEYSFPLSMTHTAYVNFIPGHAVLSSNWRHFPQARLQLAALAEKTPETLVRAYVRPGGYTALSQRIATLRAPLPMLEFGWEAVRATLEDFLDATDAIHATLAADDKGFVVRLEMLPKQGGSLERFLTKAKPARPDALLARARALAPDTLLWADARVEPAELDELFAGVVAAFGDTGRAEAKPLAVWQTSQLKDVHGPLVVARSGAAHVVLANVPAKEALHTTLTKRSEVLAGVEGIELSQAPPSLPDNGEPPTWEQLAGYVDSRSGQPLHVVDTWSGGTFARVEALDSQKALQALWSASPEGGVTPWLEVLPATPLVFVSLAVRGSSVFEGEPIRAALVASDKGLTFHVGVPLETAKALAAAAP